MKSTSARRHAADVALGLAQEYADAECALVHDSPLQLLVATILSAQCTDQRVNMVTPGLFAKYPTAADLAAVSQEDLEREIQSTGFFRNKAKSIRACCQELVETHGGEVPQDLESLVRLAGVGRKTANVVLGTAFGIASGVVVDTHVARLSKRLGLTKATQPEKIERDLMELLPQEEWVNFSHRLIHHGRRVCIARKPRCGECTLLSLCPQVGVVEKKPVKKAAAAKPARSKKSPASAVKKTTKKILRSGAKPAAAKK